MAQLTNIFLSSQRSAQSISVDNRSSVIRSNRSIITTGRGLTPANIFTLPSDRQSESGRQDDLKQVSASTLNRIPRVVGRCVTGGVVIDRYVKPGTSPTETSYIIALSHTTLTVPFNQIPIDADFTQYSDLRADGDRTGGSLGFCVTQIEFSSNNSAPIRGHNCCVSGTPQIFYNGSLCVFGSNGVVVGLADVEDYKADPGSYKTINSNFKVAIYQGHTSGYNQIFPRTNSKTGGQSHATPGDPANAFGRIPGDSDMAGLVFAVITVKDDPDLDINGLGEWKFGLDNSTNYLPADNLNTVERFNNPSNILKSYLTDTRYGVGINPDFLDDDSFEEWRVNCDLDVFNGSAYGINPGQWIYYDPDNSLGTPTSDRFMETNNAINSSLTVGENIKRITQSGLAQLHWDHETQVFRVIQSRGVRIPDIDQLFNFNSNNIMGEINITSGDFFNLPTYATVTYPDRRLNSDSNAIRMEVSEEDRLQNEPENGVQFTFPMINGRARAQTMANISLYENRNDEVIEFTGDYTTRDTRVGEYVTITDDHQGLDKQVIRLIKITEDLTPEGGLIYKYQAKKYSDRPYQPQVYSDDPNGTGENFMESTDQQIRVKELVEFYGVGVNDGIGKRYVYDYGNDPTNTTPLNNNPTPEILPWDDYEMQKYGSNSAGGWIGVTLEANKAYHNAVKITVRRTDADYWSPEYAGHTLIVPGVIDGDPGFSGNRSITYRTTITDNLIPQADQDIGPLWRFGQSGDYDVEVESFYNQSYPYEYSNKWTGTINVDTWTETVGGFTTLPDGDTIIKHSGTGTTLQDLGKLKEDQYYVTVTGTVTIGDTYNNGSVDLPLNQPGYIATSQTQDLPPINIGGVSITGSVRYVNHTTDVALPFEIPPIPVSGDTTRSTVDPLYAYNIRNISATANQPANRIQPGATYEISAKVPLEVWSERSTYPGQATLSLSTETEVYWQEIDPITGTDQKPDGQPANRYPIKGTTVDNIKMTISNNSRMRPE